MQAQLKAFLLIALLAGHEANRVKTQVDIANLINRAANSAKKTQKNFACDADVMVQAWSGKEKLNVRVQSSAMAVPVEVGRKTTDGCNVVYSLLCESDFTTLRKEVAPCEQQISGCTHCGSQPTGRRDRNFGFWKKWRSVAQHTAQSPFKFSDSFNLQHANGALKDATKVHFTPKEITCADARVEVAAVEQQLKEGLLHQENIKDKGDFKARTAMLKPFQKAKMGYDKMGCDSTPIMDTGFLDEMVGKLREMFVNVRQPDVDEETAMKRFDDTLQFVKGHTTDASLKNAIKAHRIALGKEVNTDIPLDEEKFDGIEEISPESEDMLEDMLTETSTALVQTQETKVSIGDGERQMASTQLAGPIPYNLHVGILLVSLGLAFPFCTSRGVLTLPFGAGAPQKPKRCICFG